MDFDFSDNQENAIFAAGIAGVHQRNQSIKNQQKIAAQQRAQLVELERQTKEVEKKNKINANRANIEKQRLAIEKARLEAEDAEREFNRTQSERTKQVRILIADTIASFDLMKKKFPSNE